MIRLFFFFLLIGTQVFAETRSVDQLNQTTEVGEELTWQDTKNSFEEGYELKIDCALSDEGCKSIVNKIATVFDEEANILKRFKRGVYSGGRYRGKGKYIDISETGYLNDYKESISRVNSSLVFKVLDKSNIDVERLKFTLGSVIR